jgi:hypothetical protein
VSVRFAAADNYEEVSDFYKKVLKEAGWLILPDAIVGVINAEKIGPDKNGFELSIKEVSSKKKHSSSFIIDIYYPGGRE